MPTNWHRLFGLMLTDFFAASPFVVELEKELALKKQLLDVVILRRRPGRFRGTLPDGLDDLADHNLITFKSHHEALDDWALKELTGHYVNYRKQASPEHRPLLPENQFRLYAVCSRYPHNLAQSVAFDERAPGVFEVKRGTDRIRVVVTQQLIHAERNAMLQLFSGSLETVRYGARHYRQSSPNTSGLLEKLVVGYQSEGIGMSYTMADFQRDYAKEHFKDLTPEERRSLFQELPAEERRTLLEQFAAEERLKRSSPRERGQSQTKPRKRR